MKARLESKKPPRRALEQTSSWRVSWPDRFPRPRLLDGSRFRRPHGKRHSCPITRTNACISSSLLPSSPLCSPLLCSPPLHQHPWPWFGDICRCMYMYVLYSMYVPRLCRPVTETTKMRRHLIMSSDTPAVIGRSRAANNICTSEPSSPGHMRATSRRELGPCSVL